MDIDLKNIKYLFFVGSGRTGSTLLGQIINKHPSCLISNESRYLQELVEKNKNFTKTTKLLVETAYSQFNFGLGENKQYQSSWKDIDYFKKDSTIKVIGDKKQGGNSAIYRKYTQKFEKLVEFLGENNVYFIQVTRNPVNSILSYQKSHNYSLEKSKSLVLSDTMTGCEIIEKYKNTKLIYYEDLFSNTKHVLENICNFLNIDWDNEWADSVKIVLHPPADKKYNHQSVDNLTNVYESHKIFKRYK